MLLEEVAGFIQRVLLDGGAFVLVGTDDHIRTIRPLLKQRGSERNADQLLVLDAEGTLSRFMTGDEPDWDRFRHLMESSLASVRQTDPLRRVTVFGEMVAVLWAAGRKQAAIRVEELWNQFAKVETFSLVCAYPAKLFHGADDSEGFLEICRTHSTVIPDESYTSLCSDSERLQAIAVLQQRVRALDAQAGKQKELESNLKSLVQTHTLEVEQTRMQLEGLSRELVTLRDEERRRMGQQLHESTAQLLAVLAMYVDLLEHGKQDLNPTTAQLISRSNDLVRRILREVRTLSYGFYPPTLDLVGLGSALEWYVECFKERTGMSIRLEIGRDLERLPHDVEMSIFRIVQDWLAEAWEHFEAESASVGLERSTSGVLLNLRVARKKSSTQPLNDRFGIKSREMLERLRQAKGSFETASDSGGANWFLLFPVDTVGGPS